jgi:hypothetical protein
MATEEQPSARELGTEAPVTATVAPEAPKADAPAEPTPVPGAPLVEVSPLERQAVTDQTTTGWACPKDGTPMEPMGRRGRGMARRCPTCRGVFLDVEAMRSGRQGQPPRWAPVVSSILISLVMSAVVRRLRRRRKEPLPQPPV